MPASDSPEERRGGQLLTAMFWTGVGLAPLAALLLLLGQGGGPLRVAAVLAVLAVVLIGLSITLRRDGEAVRLELEEALVQEIDMVRADVRADIATAARATHQAFGEKLQVLYENLEAMRAELEAMRAGSGAAGSVPVSPPVVSPPPPPAPPRPASAPVGARVGAAARVGVPSAVPAGVVRHTETVHVTTRQTIVDQHDDGARGTVYGALSDGGVHNGGTGGVYGGGRAADESWGGSDSLSGRRQADDSRNGHRRRSSEPSSDYLGSRRRPNEDSWGGAHGRSGEGSWGGHGLPGEESSGMPRRPRPRDNGAADIGAAEGVGAGWSEVRSGGDRWAAMRSDEHSQELRIGERRAAMHADPSGTELRVEDRWAAARRESSRQDEPRWAEPRGPDHLREGSRWDEPYRDEAWRRDGDLSAGGGDSGPEWTQVVGRRRADDSGPGRSHDVSPQWTGGNGQQPAEGTAWAWTSGTGSPGAGAGSQPADGIGQQTWDDSSGLGRTAGRDPSWTKPDGPRWTESGAPRWTEEQWASRGDGSWSESGWGWDRDAGRDQSPALPAHPAAGQEPASEWMQGWMDSPRRAEPARRWTDTGEDGYGYRR